MAQALTLVDGLAVIGGGISGAAPLFLPALVDEMNSTYTGPNGSKFRRLAQVAFNLEDPAQLQQFLKGEKREITVPGSQTQGAIRSLAAHRRGHVAPRHQRSRGHRRLRLRAARAG